VSCPLWLRHGRPRLSSMRSSHGHIFGRLTLHTLVSPWRRRRLRILWKLRGRSLRMFFRHLWWSFGSCCSSVYLVLFSITFHSRRERHLWQNWTISFPTWITLTCRYGCSANYFTYRPLARTSSSELKPSPNNPPLFLHLPRTHHICSATHEEPRGASLLRRPRCLWKAHKH
jgi:hypothetical protein